MKRILIGLALVVSAAIAQNATYGTQVNAAWYDRVAALYQNPPIVRLDTYTSDAASSGVSGYDYTAVKYPDQYVPLVYRAYVGASPSGSGGVIITTNPTPDEARAQSLVPIDYSQCLLLGEASVGERIIRNTVADLENVVNNVSLRDSIVAIAQQDRVYVEYKNSTYGRPEKVAAIVATVGGLRIPAEKIREASLVSVSRPYAVEYIASYQAEFSLKRLRDANAIQKNIVTFQHGWAKSDFCTFDLSKLP